MTTGSCRAHRTDGEIKTLTELQRFLACLAYEPVDRVPFWHWGAWPETQERWKLEGYDERSSCPITLADRRHWSNHWFFPCPPFERLVVEEPAENVVYVNEEGILMREMKNNPHSSMPQFIRFPVETREDFRRFWKERMLPDLSA